MPWMIPAAIAGSGALSAGSSLLGSGKASKGAQNAANMQMNMYNTTRGDLSPFRAAGQAALPTINALTTPGSNMTSVLRQLPGYQFALDQGLKSTQQAAAARGLGVSGASLKGAGTFATGLADQHYLDLFNTELETAKLGENAAAMTGTAGTSAANSAGNFLNQAGLAQAAGATGVGSAFTGAANNALQYSLLSKYLSPGGGTTGYIQPAGAGWASSGTNMPLQTADMPSLLPS